MKKLDWFVQTLEDEFQIEVDRNQLSYEGNELYLDGVDELFVPKELAKGLPEKLARGYWVL